MKQWQADIFDTDERREFFMLQTGWSAGWPWRCG